MRLGLALTLTASVVSVAAAAPRAWRVTGTAERAVHAQGPCRGGVRVTDEEMREWAAKTRRSPLVETTFTVFAGATRVGKPVTRFKTDRGGRFEVRLPEGVFCVMAGEQAEAAPENSNASLRAASASANANVDLACLRDRALACDAQLYVRRDGPRDMKLTLDKFTPCPEPWAQPCYRGPMPP